MTWWLLICAWHQECKRCRCRKCNTKRSLPKQDGQCGGRWPYCLEQTAQFLKWMLHATDQPQSLPAQVLSRIGFAGLGWSFPGSQSKWGGVWVSKVLSLPSALKVRVMVCWRPVIFDSSAGDWERRMVKDSTSKRLNCISILNSRMWM